MTDKTQTVESLRQKLRMIISHASGGHLSEPEDVDRSTNDIAVEISRHNNRIWEHAQEAALRDAAVSDAVRCDIESNETGCLHPAVHQGRCGYSLPNAPSQVSDDAAVERVAVDMTFAGLADEIEKAEALGYTQMSLPTNTMRQIIKALSAINSAVVERMVNRFLAWKLPADFDPDGGISFKQVFGQTWPIGTNLFTAAQAKEMVRHMLDGIAVPTNSEAVSELVRADLERIVQMRPKNSNRVTTAHLMASRAEIALAKLGSRAPSPNLRQGDTP
jgi:hypothetical protein